MYQEQEDQMYRKFYIFAFGRAVFQYLTEENKEQIKNNFNIKSVLDFRDWKICNGTYQKYNWQKLFPYMIKCEAEQIQLYNNQRFQILQQIQYAQYTNLKWLYLYDNEINNIQPLSLIYFKCLQSLYLDRNKISQIKCFKKLSIPSLNYIEIELNPLIQINALTSSKINSKTLKALFLQYFKYDYTIHQFLNVFVKLSSKQLKRLNIPSQKRVKKQDKIMSMLKLRFLSLQIFDKNHKYF